MKMFPRFILWIYALGVALASIALLLLWSGVVQASMRDLINDQTAAGAAIFLLFSIFFLIYRTSGSRHEQEPETIAHRMENGDVKITYATLEQLVERAAMRIRGVQNLKNRVRNSENGGLKIAVRFAIEADLDIPKTTAEMQQAVKEYIEATAGIPVEEVTVYVTELSTPKDVVKKRVE
ncbi:MAG: alkaline shock response membrane anchor protein AmaP [Tumebacillaceae bacterium]